MDVEKTLRTIYHLMHVCQNNPSQGVGGYNSLPHVVEAGELATPRMQAAGWLFHMSFEVTTAGALPKQMYYSNTGVS